MLRIIVGVFVVLHGLVHLLYTGQAARLFELQSGMVWPDGSWAFSALLGDAVTRLLAGALCALAAVGILAKGAWWRPAVVISASFSTAIFLLFWDGRMTNIDDKGIFAILINAAILIAVLVVGWPAFDF